MSVDAFLTIILFQVLVLVIVRYVIPKMKKNGGYDFTETTKRYYQIARRLK